MATILRFYNICSKDMKELHPLRKLLAFKLVVGVIFAESVSFFFFFPGCRINQMSNEKNN